MTPLHARRLRRVSIPLVVLAALFACRHGAPSEPAAHSAASVATRRVLPAGEVVGVAGSYGSHAWFGIPYAAPPTGERRWRAPEPAPPWIGPREATSVGAPCPQLAHPFGGVTDAPVGTLVGSEDCLTLNVWAPPFEPGRVPKGEQRLPVMVWIHGGGNTIGHAGFYDGGNLAARGDVIVVAIQYRLGPFGWFRNASLRGAGTTAADRSGNFGTLDMIRSLEWVRHNIASFGGDPGNVTIFGESAGGRDVAMLLLSPLASGLFHRAIVESGSTATLPVAAAENAVDDPDFPGEPGSSHEVLLRLLVADGTAANRSDAAERLRVMEPAEVAIYLRGKSVGEIFDAYRTKGAERLLDVPRVFADGTVLPVEGALERFARLGDYNRVPVMLGTNRDEDRLFLYSDPEYTRLWFGVLPQVKDWDRYEVTADYVSKMWKATGADEPAAALVSSGGDPVYVYRFDWDEEPRVALLFDLSRILGASHGFEIPFVFGHWNVGPQSGMLFDAGNEEGRLALSEQMMSYWTQFAYTGAPGRGRDGDLPEWQPWDPSPGGHKYLTLDTPDGGGISMGSPAVTQKSVLAEVETDPRLTSQAKKCEVYAALATAWGSAFTEADLPSVGCP